MSSEEILRKLNQNKKPIKIAGIVFNVEPTDDDVKVGLPFSEILKEMKKYLKIP
jgi:hypothetical protein